MKERGLAQPSVDGGGLEPAHGLEQGRAFVASRDEPFTFGIEETRVDAFLAERGLRALTCLLPEDMQRRWSARPGGHQGQVSGFLRHGPRRPRAD
ncbi:hypothetical protein [Nannocystis sp. SCPEA4]|uniref:hypothetical protein n=1 Tax=Nannocystis sp. SCPEA4 TaxID=2996787 RepID=UPI00226EFE50|nr:hypothetical protein [Nannocystis sp. SCPEA4]MCY1061194.1 hypothetical protein [Nannocystis sp. SCPEA4]